MPTEQELVEEEQKIRERLALLEQYRGEAGAVASEEIPERRYGSRITKGVQQQYVQRRKEAEEYLQSTAQTKEQLQQSQREIEEYKNKLAEYKREQRIQAKRRTKSKEIAYEKQQRVSYSDAGTSKALEIKPILNKEGIVIGYEDPFLQQSRLPTPLEQVSGQPTKPLVLGEKVIYPKLVYNYPRTPEPKKFKYIQWSNLIGSPVVPAKTTIQSYVAQRFNIGIGYISKPVEAGLKNIFPRSRIVNYTTKKTMAFDITGFAKAVLFAPATATTTQITTELLASKSALPKTKTSFKAGVEFEGDITKISVISASKYKNLSSLSISKTALKELEGKPAIAISREFTISKGKPSGLDIKEISSFSRIGELKEARAFRVKPIKYSAFAGTGQVVRSLYKEVRGINIKNIFDITKGKFKTIRTRTKVFGEIEVGNFQAGTIKQLTEGQYKYYGTTNPLLRIYKTGKRTIVMRNINIKGDIFVGTKSDINIFSGQITKVRPKLTPSIKNIISSSISKAPSMIVKNYAKSQIAKPIIKTSPLSFRSLYYGTGQYERTEAQVMFKPLSIEKNFIISAPRISESQRLMPRSISRVIQQPRSLNRIMTSIISVPRGAQKYKFKTIQKQPIPQKTTKSNIFPFISRVPTGKRIPPIKLNFKLKQKRTPSIYKIFGYKTYVIKSGKRIYLGGIKTKGEAIRTGELFTTKTLRATFGVQRTGKLIKGTERTYLPSMNIFRSYKIRGGKKIPLVDEFIQRRGKRLAFAPEVSAIQRTRRFRL